MIEKRKYRQARMGIQSGDMLAWSDDNASGWHKFILNMIRLGTRSEYSHIGIACWVKDRLYVLEAKSPVIRFVPLSTVESFYHVPMNIVWQDKYTEKLKTYIGLEYSVIEALKAYLGIQLKDHDKWQCAELANRFYEYVGINLGDAFTPQSIVKKAMAVLNTPIYFIEKGEFRG